MSDVTGYPALWVAKGALVTWYGTWGVPPRTAGDSAAFMMRLVMMLCNMQRWLKKVMCSSRTHALLQAFFTQQWTYGIENGAVLQPVLATIDPVVHRSRKRAAAYYEEQRPLFEAAAKHFYLNQHFVETARNFSSRDTSFYDLVEKRLRAMAMLLEKQVHHDCTRVCHGPSLIQFARN